MFWGKEKTKMKELTNSERILRTNDCLIQFTLGKIDFTALPKYKEGEILNFAEIPYIRISGVGKIEDWVDQISCYLKLEDVTGINHTHKVLGTYDHKTTLENMKKLHKMD